MYLQEFTATHKKLKQRVVVYSIGHNEYDAADRLRAEYSDIHFTGRESKLGKDWDENRFEMKVEEVCRTK